MIHQWFLVIGVFPRRSATFKVSKLNENPPSNERSSVLNRSLSYMRNSFLCQLALAMNIVLFFSSQ